MMTNDTPVWQLTVGELQQIIRDTLPEEAAASEIEPAPRDDNNFFYHLDGIAEIFGCSRTQAWRIKQSGIIDGAITQVGNLIVTDRAKALELVREASRKRHKTNKPL